MHKGLATALVEKGVIGYNTKVTAKHEIQSFSTKTQSTSVFLFKRLIQDNENIFFELVSPDDLIKHTLPAENILNIDGMDPVRIAAVYNLRADGNPKITGKKRGRKPKNLKAAVLAA